VSFSPPTNGRFYVRRFIGVALFLFLFALPLHFHSVTDRLQVSQECSCYRGGLCQLGSAPAVAVLSLVSEVFLASAPTTESAVGVTVESESARAPPYSL
jgi:hypothetical protein